MKEFHNIVSIDDLEGLRTREIKKLLLEKLGASYEQVSKILDRRELKELAYELIMGQNRDIATKEAFQYTLWAATFILSLPVLFLFRKQIYWYSYGIRKRCSAISIALKHSMFLAMFMLLIGLALELFNYLLQIHALCTWVLPSRYFKAIWLPMISVPLSIKSPMEMINKKFINPDGNNKNMDNSYSIGGDNNNYETNTSPNQTSTSYGMDIGPMVTIYICKYIQNKIENYANTSLLNHMNSPKSSFQNSHDNTNDINSNNESRYYSKNIQNHREQYYNSTYNNNNSSNNTWRTEKTTDDLMRRFYGSNYNKKETNETNEDINNEWDDDNDDKDNNDIDNNNTVWRDSTSTSENKIDDNNDSNNKNISPESENWSNID